jgi:DNA-binding NtrC family response regulator
LAVLVSAGQVLLAEHLPEDVRRHGPRLWRGMGDSQPPRLLRRHRQDAERDMILRILVDHQFHRGRTAEALGVTRMTLYTKMKKYGLLGG